MGRIIFRVIKNLDNNLILVGLFFENYSYPITTFVQNKHLWEQFKANPQFEFGEDLS